MNVGLLMIREENDILERVLELNDPIFDVLYVLDGTEPSELSFAICAATGKLASYWHDTDLDRPIRDGSRGFLYDQAVQDHGWDHWFLELHGDEVWTFHPGEVIAADPDPDSDGFIFRLPFYFPREAWQDDVHPLDQLTWHMIPGWPEFRMFHGNPDVHFNPEQHFNTQPAGLNNVVMADFRIKHYPYRSPQVQRARAAVHEQTGFDPDNYRHVVNGDQVIWTDEMIEGAICVFHTTVERDTVNAG